MVLALIDADTIYYRAAFKMSKPAVRKAIDITMGSIKNALIDFDDYQQKVAVKGRDNFRKELYPPYKSNRVTKEEIKPYLNYGHNYMKEKYNAEESTGMEADDLVAIWAYEAREMEIPYCIVGIDKDLLQIPGNHFNFNKDEHRFIDDDEGYRLLMHQCLTGDNSDGIPGIKGIGPAKASKILAGVPSDRLWNRVRAAHRAHRSGVDVDVTYRLLKMLTSRSEYEDIRAQVSSKADECESHVRQEGKDNIQDS